MAKRLRILAGYNGSGKTSIYKDLRDEFSWSVFVNADIIEQTLRAAGELNLSAYSVCHITFEQFADHYQHSMQAKISICTLENINLEDDVLILKDVRLLNSYFSAFVASFIYLTLIDLGVSFSLETVMSHPSKLDIMRLAKEKGYRVYLYYVSTSSPEINVGRVQTRIEEGGHSVDEAKIRSRYTRSLEQLPDAVRLSDRAYIFDNSGKTYQWIAEYDAAVKHLKVYCEQPWLKNILLDNHFIADLVK